MARHSKKRDKLFKKIVWIMCFVMVIFLCFALRTPTTPEQKTSSPRFASANSEVGDAYETFNLEKEGISFVFPKIQAPLVSVGQITNALERLKSRDFIIGIYNGPGFVYYPQIDTTTAAGCEYDGALHEIRSNDGLLACDFERRNEVALYNEFTSGTITKLIELLPVNHREYFMSISIEYENDCTDNQPVCDARLQQKRDKLKLFTKVLLEKNHNLFTQ